MRQIPMLFNAAMIQAMLAGRKTETRRAFKDAPEGAADFIRDDDGMWDCILDNGEIFPRDFAPRARPGDLIWVREGWRIGAWQSWREDTSGGRGDCPVWGGMKHSVAVDYLADNHARKEWIGGGDDELMARLVNQSRQDAEKDGRFNAGERFEYRWAPGQSPCRARPSIHMPKWASRLTLRVTSYGIEPLHDITEAGAVAEGCIMSEDTDDNGVPFPAEIPHSSGIGHVGWDSARDWYADLWDSINGDGAWEANPWVEVTRFEVIRQNISEVEA